MFPVITCPKFFNQNLIFFSNKRAKQCLCYYQVLFGLELNIISLNLNTSVLNLRIFSA